MRTFAIIIHSNKEKYEGLGLDQIFKTRLCNRSITYYSNGGWPRAGVSGVAQMIGSIHKPLGICFIRK
jgi:hypothetical protein